MSRFSLRLRLTLLVTVLFGIALTVAAVAGTARMETSLRADTRSNAEALLIDYLGQLQGGSIGPGDPAPEDATRFLYLDAAGNDLTDLEYQQILFEAVAAQIDDLPFPDPTDAVPFSPEALIGETIIVESETVEIAVLPDPDADLMQLDRSDDVIAVGYPVRIGNTPVTIAVSTPLQPVTDSVAAVGRLLLILVPALTFAIATATWLIVGRALRPVDAIAAQVDRISNESLNQRVPQPDADDEIGHLATTMNQMLDRLQSARDTQRQFISDASHELRSPITATRSTLEVARSQPHHTDWPATADILHNENARLSALVDDLLLLARLDETDRVDSRQDVDLDELCLTEASRPHPRPVHVHVKDPVRISGNLNNLTRAMRNLVDNAARHATTRVDITVTEDNGSAVVEVADDGPGIPEQDRERIFDRFSRLDDSRNRTHGEGAGLGLAIAKRIITSHHGTLTATNNPQGGARLTITLPLPTLPS